MARGRHRSALLCQCFLIVATNLSCTSTRATIHTSTELRVESGNERMGWQTGRFFCDRGQNDPISNHGINAVLPSWLALRSALELRGGYSSKTARRPRRHERDPLLASSDDEGADRRRRKKKSPAISPTIPQTRSLDSIRKMSESTELKGTADSDSGDGVQIQVRFQPPRRQTFWY